MIVANHVKFCTPGKKQIVTTPRRRRGGHLSRIWLVETRNAAKHPANHRKVSSQQQQQHQQKHYWAQDNKMAKLRNPSYIISLLAMTRAYKKERMEEGRKGRRGGGKKAGRREERKEEGRKELRG